MLVKIWICMHLWRIYKNVEFSFLSIISFIMLN